MYNRPIRAAIKLKVLAEEIYKAAKYEKLASGERTAPVQVQVDLRHHRLANNIYKTLHEGDGTRLDVNIWEFPSMDIALTFVDSLKLLGIEDKHIQYPGSFLALEDTEEESNNQENQEEISELEQDLFSSETPAEEVESETEEQEAEEVEDIDTEDLEIDLEEEEVEESDVELKDLESELEEPSQEEENELEADEEVLAQELQDLDADEELEDLMKALEQQDKKLS